MEKLVVHAKAESALLQLSVIVVDVFAFLLLHKFAGHLFRIRLIHLFLSQLDLRGQFEYIINLIVFVEVVVLDNDLMLLHLLTLKLRFFLCVFSFAFSADF